MGKATKSDSPPTTLSSNSENIPRHVAVIMDGNGRWAERRGLPRLAGHEEGAESVRAIMRAAKDVGVEYLSLYAFSVENWTRPKLEIAGLMKLLNRFLKNYEKDLHKNRIRLRVIGRTEDLPDSTQHHLTEVEEKTREYSDRHLILALSYGSRTEIAHAARCIARQVKAGELDEAQVDESTIAANLYAPDIPDPDLLIRTSGELRLSNFLLWQLSYAELYFTDILWPDFREQHFVEAIQEYGNRQRRFGDIGQR